MQMFCIWRATDNAGFLDFLFFCLCQSACLRVGQSVCLCVCVQQSISSFFFKKTHNYLLAQYVKLNFVSELELHKSQTAVFKKPSRS